MSTNHEAPFHYAVLQSHVTSSLSLSSKYPPQHPILEKPKPAFFRNVTDQVLHPYKTGTIIVLCQDEGKEPGPCSYIFMSSDKKRKTQKFLKPRQPVFV